SALVGVVAQRMVRRVCSHCGKETPVPPMESVAYAREMGEERSLFNQGPGCQACSDTGFQGRTGIFELLQVNDDIRELMLHRSDAASIRARAIEDGMVPLVRDGMLKAGAGITTPAEVLRNVMIAA
ncbi:MAG: type II/IV secretion system protein, partial [Dehalococcoidales bacterium]